MKKTIFCRIAGLVLTLCLLCGMLSWLNRATYLKGFPNRYDGFLSSDQPYDVFLLGNSHMWDGVFPMELWNRQGITSYNLSFAGAQPGALYWILRCALEHSEPEVLVMDCSSLASNSTAYLPFFRNAMAAFPFSVNKICAAYDLCPPGQFSADDRFSLIWGFSAFHSRWSELSAEDLRWEEPRVRGAYPIVNIAEVPPPFKTSEKYRFDDSSPNLPYLRRIAEECQKRGIRLILTTLPYSASENGVMVANAIEDLAAELNLPYLNLLACDLVDYRCDFADRDAHLNVAGACKVSAYLADCLAESCALPDHRADPAYADWDADYAAWCETMDSFVAQQLLFRFTLMLLSHSRYAPVIRISPDSGLFDDERILPLLRGLCGGADLPGFAEAAAAGRSYVLFFDRSAGKAYESVGTDRISDTPFGEILVRPDNCLVRVGDNESTLAFVCEDASSAEAQCFVFTSDMTPLPFCSHSFTLGEGGEYYRNDYPE